MRLVIIDDDSGIEYEVAECVEVYFAASAECTGRGPGLLAHDVAETLLRAYSPRRMTTDEILDELERRLQPLESYLKD